MPLLYALRNDLGMNNPHFGCGLAQCGACTVHLNGEPVRSCVMPLSAAAGKTVTTIKGLGTPEKPHPLQAAYVAEQVPQCGYCVNGWIMTAAATLKKNPKASDAELREALAGLKCDTATSCNQGGASGSFGVSHGGKLLRSAAAEARRVLVEGASKRLGVPAAQLRVEDGTVIGPNGKTTYGELIGGKHFNHQVEWNKQVGNFMDIKVQAKPKAPSEYKVVGKPIARRDVAWKVFGTDDYVTDVRVKGMLHARVIRPPRAACK